MSSPPSQPNDAHTHEDGICPVTGNTHEFCPPQEGDSRSPCPALNTLANHGYLRRDGKDLTKKDFVKGLKEGYNLSPFLANFLAIGSYILLRRTGKLSLHDLGIHGKIEHDASLVHKDTPKGETFAPIQIQPDLVEALINDVEPSSDSSDPEKPAGELKKLVVDASDVARARVRRQKDSPKLNILHGEIARGEMGIALGVFEKQVGNKKGIPVDWLRDWIGSEKLPEGWRPDHVQGFLGVVHRAKAVRLAMGDVRKKEKAAKESAEKAPQSEAVASGS